MIFAAKRRQRVIPVGKTPPNRSLAFMQLISNLFYQKRDHAQILSMKYRYFCIEVKQQLGINLEGNPEDADFKRLSEKTGIAQDTLKSSIRTLQIAIYRDVLDEKQLKEGIDLLNDILRAMEN